MNWFILGLALAAAAVVLLIIVFVVLYFIRKSTITTISAGTGTTSNGTTGTSNPSGITTTYAMTLLGNALTCPAGNSYKDGKCYAPGGCATGTTYLDFKCYADCPAGTELYKSICITKCPAGWTSTDSSCKKPANFTATCESIGLKTTGATSCGRPSVDRAAGTAPAMPSATNAGCPTGKTQVGTLCYEPCMKGFAQSGTSCVPSEHMTPRPRLPQVRIPEGARHLLGVFR